MIGIVDEFGGRGLELLQAIIQHFIPAESVNLPFIFRGWTRLQQKQNEPASVWQSSQPPDWLLAASERDKSSPRRIRSSLLSKDFSRWVLRLCEGLLLGPDMSVPNEPSRYHCTSQDIGANHAWTGAKQRPSQQDHEADVCA